MLKKKNIIGMVLQERTKKKKRKENNNNNYIRFINIVGIISICRKIYLTTLFCLIKQKFRVLYFIVDNKNKSNYKLPILNFILTCRRRLGFVLKKLSTRLKIWSNTLMRTESLFSNSRT